MHILVINFQLGAISEGQYREHVERVAPVFTGIPGLIAKAWLADAETNTYGGIYVFEDRDSVDEYLGSAIVAGVRENPAFSNYSARVFDTIESATAVTQGRLALVPTPAVA